MDRMLPRPRFWAESAAQCKTCYSLVGELLIFLLLYVISALIQGFVLTIPTTVWVMGTGSEEMMTALAAGATPQSVMEKLLSEMPDWLSLVSLFASSAMGAVALVYCKNFQKRSPASMGLRGRAPLLEYLLGFGFGLALFCAAMGIGTATEGFALLRQAPSGSRLALGLLALPGCMLQGASLELLIRGYYTPSLGGRYPVGLTLLLSTLAPVMLQSGGSLFSLSAVNALLLGLLLGIWCLKRGNLWSACALRGAWLFASGWLFDFAPAGKHTGVRLLDVDVDLFRPSLSGGAYGPQAGLCVTVVLLAGLMLVLALKPLDPAPQAPRDEQAANYL